MSIKINKNGKEYDLGFIPEHYPADRVYLHGDTDDDVESAIDSIQSTLSQELYEEHTTRETSYTSDIVKTQNTNFLSNGYYSVFKKHKQVTIHVGGISIKNALDWMLILKSGYRPSRKEYFPYYLGNQLCRCYVQSDGYLYFETLNNSDTLSATITFNIA